MRDFTTQLAATIHPLTELATDADFGAILMGLTSRLTQALEPTEGERAALIAADAVTMACQRDGVDGQARAALRALVTA